MKFEVSGSNSYLKNYNWATIYIRGKYIGRDNTYNNEVTLIDFVTWLEENKPSLKKDLGSIGDYISTATKDFLTVGCQTIPFSEVERVYLAMKELQK